VSAADLSPAQVHTASSCPDCHAPRPRMCRNADGSLRAHPHRNRRLLAHALAHERLLDSIGSRLHRRADPGFRVRTAWDAGRAWDRDEAEALRLWLRCYGSVLWERTRTTSGTL
jgi:hypothetical protein